MRKEGPTFFGICGDVLQEDVYGSDYKGTNTVELINYLDLNCLSLGNHELDYGLAHLFIFKECVRPPALCANMVVSKMGQMLFKPSTVCEIGGVRILLIGVIPQSYFNIIMSDEFCRCMLDYRETYDGIRVEIEAHKGEEIYRVGITKNCAANTMKYFSMQLDDDRLKVLSLSTYNDLAKWCLGRTNKVRAPEKGRFILHNFEG